MIHFFPYLREQIDSGRSGENICMVLYSALEQGKLFLSLDVEYTGQVYPSHFKICPKEYKGEDAFLPDIKGTVTEKEDGSVIDVVMQMSIYVRIFMLVWNGGLLLYFLIVLLAVFFNGFDDMLFLVWPFFMMAGGQYMMRHGFNDPARRALKELKELIC